MTTRDSYIGEYRSRREPLSGVVRWMDTVSRWRKRMQQRRELQQLDAWTQRDLGLTDADIWLETNKRPWQA